MPDMGILMFIKTPASPSASGVLLRCNPGIHVVEMFDVCMCAQIADFGMSRVLENNMTHVSTNTHGESHHTFLCSLSSYTTHPGV